MSYQATRREMLAGLAAAGLWPRGVAAAKPVCRDFEWLLGRRRMVRKFRAEPVAPDLVEKLIAAATRAPSAGNLQPWAFVVVRDERRRRRLGEAAFGQTWLADAPVSIVPCADPRRSRPRYGERGERYALIDTSFASLLLLLAVTDIGLGACFVGAFDDALVREILELPDAVQPLAVVSVGHPAESPEPLPLRPQSDVVHDELW
jgi:nitroreductase